MPQQEDPCSPLASSVEVSWVFPGPPGWFLLQLMLISWRGALFLFLTRVGDSPATFLECLGKTRQFRGAEAKGFCSRFGP